MKVKVTNAEIVSGNQIMSVIAPAIADTATRFSIILLGKAVAPVVESFDEARQALVAKYIEADDTGKPKRQPILDDDGNSKRKPLLAANGEPVLDDNGDPKLGEVIYGDFAYKAAGDKERLEHEFTELQKMAIEVHITPIKVEKFVSVLDYDKLPPAFVDDVKGDKVLKFDVIQEILWMLEV
ncbi:MAG: hypothetical protein KDE47_19890 [Caldilineaceae bacterium]|nr:hypothetical protein [Caldilineaceae bacterium]